MTPPPFGTFPKIHPFWKCHPSLSLETFTTGQTKFTRAAPVTNMRYESESPMASGSSNTPVQLSVKSLGGAFAFAFACQQIFLSGPRILLLIGPTTRSGVFVSTARCSNRTSLLSRIQSSPSVQSNPLIAFEQSKQFRTDQDRSR